MVVWIGTVTYAVRPIRYRLVTGGAERAAAGSLEAGSPPRSRVLPVSVPASLSTTAVPPRRTLMQVVYDERQFLALVGVAVAAAAVTYPYPDVARWVGFTLAAYSAVANDSIQTVGVFIASNKRRPWWLLWLFIGGVFLATVLYGWAAYGGDVSYGRLASKGFAEAPQTFSFLQVAAPVVLLVVTRLRMPVSTTFLLLSCFATTPGGIWEVLEKSLWGYVVAFATALVAWAAVGRLMRRVEERPMSPVWYPLQWLATGALWAAWIMQDAANLAVYLPRTLSGAEVAAFAGVVVAGLGVLFFLRGDTIQRVVDEKSGVEDVRSATVIDFVYAIVLFGFKEVSTIPMSTTWVFIGLLAGRELVLALRGASDRPLRVGLRLAGRDVLYATAGLVISVLLAFAANPAFRAAVLG